MAWIRIIKLFFRPNETYGTLHYYDKIAMDKVSVKNPIPLEKFQAAFYFTSTTDDPVIQKVSLNHFDGILNEWIKLASSNVGNVFATG